MATITTIAGTDLITNSRTVLNTNFSNLNTDKIETSVIDTDTTLAANSDAKIPSQKAVKAYVDAGGNVNASETVKGISEEGTDAEVLAGTATGGTGARLFVNAAKLATRLGSTITRYTSGTATKNLADATAATQTIAHGLGRTPTKVIFKGLQTTSNVTQITHGTFSSGSYATIASFMNEGGGSATTDTSFMSTTYALILLDSATAYQTATVAVDATNITLTWTKTASPTNTYSFIWEAEFI